MSALVCWNCGENLADIPLPVSRQANCAKCFSELHCCRLCRHYDPNASTTCFEDRADTPLQKENSNFCEFFIPQAGAFKSHKAVKSDTARGDLDALFDNRQVGSTADADTAHEIGEHESPDQQQQAKNKLDDLFR